MRKQRGHDTSANRQLDCRPEMKNECSCEIASQSNCHSRLLQYAPLREMINGERLLQQWLIYLILNSLLTVEQQRQTATLGDVQAQDPASFLVSKTCNSMIPRSDAMTTKMIAAHALLQNCLRKLPDPR